MLKFGIDATWVRHKIVGGTESFLMNLLNGFMETALDFKMVIIAASDNHFLFDEFLLDKRIKLVKADVKSQYVAERIIWQNVSLSKLLVKEQIAILLVPVYCKPILDSNKIKYVTVIHDLEALHFPENHSFATNTWLRIAWKNAAKTSDYVIAISDYVRNDIINTYRIDPKKIETIYDPISISVEDRADFSAIEKKYSIKEQEYYYTVSKLNKHKNLATLVKVFGEIKKRNNSLIPCKLVISGVNGGMQGELERLAEQYDIVDNIILTGFVENPIRNALYANSRAFLFPSVFEGFGMPPIEAICCGIPVITTREACIPEITQNLANYVDDPYDVDQWISTMGNAINKSDKFDISIYEPKRIAEKYLQVLSSLI